MHPESLFAMENMLSRYQGEAAGEETSPMVLDVGSLNVNGSYRELIEGRGWQYTGLDVAPGPNVDVVAGGPYCYPFEDGEFDVVISGSTMEHVQSVWLWVPELVRVLRPGGLLAIVTHWCFPEHRFPVDCWRILPDGMRHLFDLTCELAEYNIALVSESDIAASAVKVRDR